VINKFAYATRGGSNPSNPKKINQDSFILSPTVNHNKNHHFFAVCDGHGLYGR
jgi:serine/threonine protein phosphatase PrpC